MNVPLIIFLSANGISPIQRCWTLLSCPTRRPRFDCAALVTHSALVQNGYPKQLAAAKQAPAARQRHYCMFSSGKQDVRISQRKRRAGRGECLEAFAQHNTKVFPVPWLSDRASADAHAVAGNISTSHVTLV